MTTVEPKALVRRLNATCVQALETAVERAASGRYYEIVVEHMLHALALQEGTDVGALLQHVERDQRRFAQQTEKVLQNMRTGNGGRPVFSERLFDWIEGAWLIASVEQGQTEIRSGHLLLEFLRRQSRYSSERYAELEDISFGEAGRNFSDITSASCEAPAAAGAVPAGPAVGSREALERFTTSLTDKARRGDIDAIFGRDREIRQVIDILCRRRKNNPIIVGEPGVGKTALAEGLALAIAREEVPDELRNVEILALDLGALKAGASVRGELENRLKKVLAEVKAAGSNIILFIDEAHTLIGGQNGDNDLPNLLKPALARGELRTIAATTYSEFKRYFDKDPAFERRFQPVQVDEPRPEDAVEMLRGLRSTYEQAHGVRVRDEAVIAAVHLSDRYITGRQLPDKAIDLIDTACARVKIERAAPPAPLVAVRSQIAALEREIESREVDVLEGAVEDDTVLSDLRARCLTLAEEMAVLDQKLALERSAVTALQEATTALRAASDDAGLRLELRRCRDTLKNLQGEHALVHHEVDRDAIEQVVSEWTGIPVGKMQAGTIEVLLGLEDELRSRIKGQDHAVASVAKAIRVSQAGVREPNAPIAVLLFVGPSGVGKTETAAALADAVYGGERSVVTINMSEFQEKHTVSRLIGSPPGYVGYGEGGVLTEAVRQKPYSVVLLDECEKADIEVMNLFYQVFDKGMLCDGEGREINFRNTVVILTSNLATDEIVQAAERLNSRSSEADVSDVQALVDVITPTLTSHFKPALLARMTVVPFLPLDRPTLREIGRGKLQRLAERIGQAHDLEVSFEDEVVDELVARCTNPQSGARAIDHAMRSTLMPMLSTALLERMAAGSGSERLAVSSHEGQWSFDFVSRSESATVDSPHARELALN